MNMKTANVKAESRKQQAAILTIRANMHGFQMQKIKPDIFMAYTNQVLVELMPAVEKYSGNIDKWNETNGAGLVAFFEKDAEGALRAALEIIRKGQTAYAMGISYGSVIWGNIGTGKHKSAITLSEDKKASDYLQLMASRYGVGILVTAAYTEQIPDFEKHYTCRQLGKVSMENAGMENTGMENDGQEQAVYEVFEGEPEEKLFLKQKTRMVFEEGIHLFQTGKAERARRHFIEVLKIDREDKVAREYLRRCDRSTE